MRQGNDMGTQYRSGIYTYSAAQAGAEASHRRVQRATLGGWLPNAITAKSSIASFTMPRSITSNTLIRIPRDIAVLAEHGACGIRTGVALGRLPRGTAQTAVSTLRMREPRFTLCPRLLSKVNFVDKATLGPYEQGRGRHCICG